MNEFSRRASKCIGMIGLAIALPAVLQADSAKPSSLREFAGDRFLIGTAMTANELNQQKLTSLIAEQFACVTFGNEMKPDALQRVKGRFTFDTADAMVDFVRSHGLEVIGHTLCWHQQSPKWLFEDEKGQPLPREVALDNLRTHIQTVVKHFKGKVKGFDVVNEAISDGPGYLRDTPARRAIGDDYILKAFEFAHEADPDVELYYNDYNIDQDYKRDRALRLIREIKAAGLRIDAVGIQGHYQLKSPPIDEIERGLKAFSDLGVDVMITELDVDVLPRADKRGGADLNATEKSAQDPYRGGLPENVQKDLTERYRALFSLFVKTPRIKRITFWGTADGGSWLNNFPARGRVNYPLLFDRQLKPKPAFEAVRDVLQHHAEPH